MEDAPDNVNVPGGGRKQQILRFQAEVDAHCKRACVASSVVAISFFHKDAQIWEAMKS